MLPVAYYSECNSSGEGGRPA